MTCFQVTGKTWIMYFITTGVSQGKYKSFISLTWISPLGVYSHFRIPWNLAALWVLPLHIQFLTVKIIVIFVEVRLCKTMYIIYIYGDDRFYVVLFSDLEQTHCAHVILHGWLAFYSAFLNIHQSGVLRRWHGWCHMKLLPSQCKFCVHHTTMHHVTSCKATYVRCMRV